MRRPKKRDVYISWQYDQGSLLVSAGRDPELMHQIRENGSVSGRSL